MDGNVRTKVARQIPKDRKVASARSATARCRKNDARRPVEAVVPHPHRAWQVEPERAQAAEQAQGAERAERAEPEGLARTLAAAGVA